MKYQIGDNCVYKRLENYSDELNELLGSKNWNDFKIVRDFCDQNNIMELFLLEYYN